MCYYIFFGSLSIAMGGILYLLIYSNTNWNPYAVWVAAWSVATFVMYGLDKGLSETIRKVRTPEFILHLLAMLGGFPGGWLGRAFFGHKTNVREKPWFLIILFLSTLGHGLLIYYRFLSGS
ncbi:MAG: DUF1294 domain-containing protein [Anaerolineae bacterium]